ncbi:MAG: FMN-binding protein [Spirochaeta sp.]|nr:FMN-binding protein [Spirochaeta sp.]
MKSQFWKERIFPVVFMVAVTVVFISVVSGIYLSTREMIKLNESLFLKRAVLYAADITVPGQGEAADQVYRSRVRERLGSEGLIDHFEILEDNEIRGYVVFAGGPGLWGKIEAVIGFTETRDQLTGVEFIKQNETPGLGARIAEEWFKVQFRGKKGPFVLVPEGTAVAERELDAITGATWTSNFVLDIINQSLEDVKEGEWPKQR